MPTDAKVFFPGVTMWGPNFLLAICSRLSASSSGLLPSTCLYHIHLYQLLSIKVCLHHIHLYQQLCINFSLSTPLLCVVTLRRASGRWTLRLCRVAGAALGDCRASRRLWTQAALGDFL